MHAVGSASYKYSLVFGVLDDLYINPKTAYMLLYSINIDGNQPEFLLLSFKFSYFLTGDSIFRDPMV